MKHASSAAPIIGADADAGAGLVLADGAQRPAARDASRGSDVECITVVRHRPSAPSAVAALRTQSRGATPAASAAGQHVQPRRTHRRRTADP